MSRLLLTIRDSLGRLVGRVQHGCVDPGYNHITTVYERKGGPDDDYDTGNPILFLEPGYTVTDEPPLMIPNPAGPGMGFIENPEAVKETVPPPDKGTGK